MPSVVYDTIIVGGGSAGCVLASRLSADPTHRVLVLEAGRSDALWDLFIHWPGGAAFSRSNRLYDWRYISLVEPSLLGRNILHTYGKVLGGSSSINDMIVERGHPQDYETWSQGVSMEAWDYAHCLPYFIRSEARTEGDDLYHGRSGPLALARRSREAPHLGAFFRAAEEAGYLLTDDTNGHQPEGLGVLDRNIHRGRRLSAARAYLYPVLARRPNLHVVCRAPVTKILFEGRRAIGVEFIRGRRTQIARAGEIVCSAGGINSPKLLQLSGVGNARELESIDIPLVHDLPGVGESLQDHLEVEFRHRYRSPLWESRARWSGQHWLFPSGRRAAMNHTAAGGFVRSNERVDRPDLRVQVFSKPACGGHSYHLHVGPATSDSRGSVKLRSADPRFYPLLKFNYLATERDRRTWVEAIRCARQILRQPSLGSGQGAELSPDPLTETDEDILEWVAHHAESASHASCTCKMGTDAMSVVDPRTLRVHGVDGLRVVDASVMPCITSGDLFAPVVMIAEKAADIILGNTPLSPVERWYGTVLS